MQFTDHRPFSGARLPHSVLNVAEVVVLLVHAENWNNSSNHLNGTTMKKRHNSQNRSWFTGSCMAVSGDSLGSWRFHAVQE